VHDSQPVRALPPVYKTCEISFNRADPAALAGHTPVVGTILKCATHGKAPPPSRPHPAAPSLTPCRCSQGKYTFSMMKVAEEAGMSTVDVDLQLQLLRRNKEATFTLKAAPPTLADLPC
jgi:hypothetical protein